MNGIGGRTIAEAKRNLTYQEFLYWCKYRNETGSLNVGSRVELSTAMVATVTANVHGNKKKPTDFMPNHKEQAIGIEDAFMRLKATAKPKAKAITEWKESEVLRLKTDK